MERVLGIGGYFMRAADPMALGAWYRDCLGLDADEHGLWRQETGPTVFATFESRTGYFGSRDQQTMLNFRVRDLDAMLAQLRAKGADVAKQAVTRELTDCSSRRRRHHGRRSTTFACRSFPTSSMRRRGSAAASLEWSLSLE